MFRFSHLSLFIALASMLSLTTSACNERAASQETPSAASSTGKKHGKKGDKNKDDNGDGKNGQNEETDPKDDKNKCSESSQVQLGPYGWYTFVGEKYEEAIELFLASQLEQSQKRGPLTVGSVGEVHGMVAKTLAVDQKVDLSEKYTQTRSGKWDVRFTTKGGRGKAIGFLTASANESGVKLKLKKINSTNNDEDGNKVKGKGKDKKALHFFEDSAQLRASLLTKDGEYEIKLNSAGVFLVRKEGVTERMSYALDITLNIMILSNDEIEIRQSDAQLRIGRDKNTLFKVQTKGSVKYKNLTTQCPVLVGAIGVESVRGNDNVAKSVVFSENNIKITEDNATIPLVACESRPTVDYSRIFGESGDDGKDDDAKNGSGD